MNMSNIQKKKILFVCLGNICRSPAAEGVMKKFSEGKAIEIDSAGTAGYHIGELPDSRMRSHAAKRGFPLTHRARQFDSAKDFERFDLILAMDKNNMRDLQSMDRKNQYGHKLKMMTDYSQALKVTEVPDPYYGGPEGFEHVLDILEDACGGLLKEL
ncbi:MAG: low molecular weight protein-tyrosine-phosphatase [Bacteroidota bacterium]